MCNVMRSAIQILSHTTECYICVGSYCNTDTVMHNGKALFNEMYLL